MKKFLILSLTLFLTACGAGYQVNPQIINSAVDNGYQVIYSPEGKFWSDGGMVEDRIVFTKTISSGSGSYSEYTAQNYPMITMPTQYEFLFDQRLIGYSTAELKFYEVVYDQKEFKIKQLMPEQVQAIFPKLEIVRVSSEKDGELVVKKMPFETKSFLILNDTDQYFYRYSFENGVKEGVPFKSLLTVNSFETIVFSHFGTQDKMFPVLKIKIGM